MQIAYIDESGKPNFKDNEKFVLSCLIVQECKWEKIHKEVHKIKKKYYPLSESEGVEFHAKEIIRGRKEHKILKSMEDRLRLFGEIYDLIKNSEITIINVLINKEKVFPHKKSTFDIETWGFRLLYERLGKFMKKINEDKENNTYEYCILIIDSINKEADNNLRLKIQEFVRDGTLYSSHKYIIEEAIFTDSKWRCLSQLADCIAFCIGRVHNNRGTNLKLTDKFKEFYDLIEPRFDRSKKGVLEGCGLVIFPK